MPRPSVNAIHPLRRAYFALTVALVVVGVPLLYAYTSGFRFTSGTRLVATGALAIDSQPSGATVVVNGHPAPDRTPLRAPALTPGRYHVALSKVGYRTWSKTLTVEPGRATLALSVQLLLETPTGTILADAPDQVSLAPPGSVLLERRGIRWTLRRLPGNTAEDLGPGAPWSSVRWSLDGRRAVVWTVSGPELLIVGVPSRRTTVPDAVDAAFDPLDSDSVLLAAPNGVVRWSPTSRVQQLLTEGGAISVRAVGTRIAWGNANGPIVSAPRTVSGGIGSTIEPLPGTAFGPDTGNGTLLTIGADSTFMVPGGDPSRSVAVPMKATSADETRGTLALASLNEAWGGSGSPELLYRSTERVGAVAWLSGASLLVVQAGDRVLAVELDGRDHRTVTEIYRASGVQLLGVDGNGRLLVNQPEASGVANPGLVALTLT